MPEYTLRANPRARARDFYDIHAVVTERNVDLGSPENLDLFRAIFAAKEVPLSLIPKIAGQREFHRVDWPVVKDSVSGSLEPFEFYFGFVVDRLSTLHSLWEE